MGIIPNYDAWLEQGNPYNYEPAVVHECDCCGGDIFEGDDYYEIGDEKWCVDCIKSSKKVAEVSESVYYPDEDRAYDEWKDRQLEGD